MNDVNDNDKELLEEFDDDDDDDKDENVNREQDKNKDDSIKIDINDINLSKLDTISEKKYSSLVLKRLKAADPQLFVSPYTSKCQAVQKQLL